MPRPRDLDALEYLAARDRIFSIMGMDTHAAGSASDGRD
jgi:hypothetical protein